MEANLGQRRRGLEEKIPDMKNSLAVVEMLQQRKARLQLGVYPKTDGLPRRTQTQIPLRQPLN